jgi:DNA-binding transcriptional LysR family regulator
MELRHLRYFITVADELSFSRAAERLNMAQPPLSQQIQALETEMGAKLFDRTKRPLQLTLAGQAFLLEARSTLANLEQAVQRIQLIHQGELGHLSIGFTSSIANGILPNILRTFRQQYPAVKLILREENSSMQLHGLRDRQTDVVFLYQDHQLLAATDLDIMLFRQEPLVVALPEKHPLTKKATVSIVDLMKEEFVMPSYQVVSGLPEKIYGLCEQARFTPKVALEAVFTVTILGLVAAEIGISILPASVQNLQRAGVVYRPIKEETIANQLIAVWRKQNSSIILQRFLEVAGECGDRSVQAETLDL